MFPMFPLVPDVFFARRVALEAQPSRAMEIALRSALRSGAVYFRAIMNEEELLCWRGFQAYFNNKANQELGFPHACSVKTEKGKRYVVLTRNVDLKKFSIPFILRVYRVRTQGGGMLKMLKRYPRELGQSIESDFGRYYLEELLKEEQRYRSSFYGRLNNPEHKLNVKHPVRGSERAIGSEDVELL